MQHGSVTEQNDVIAHPHPGVSLRHDDIKRLIVGNIVEVCGNCPAIQRRIDQHVLARDVGERAQDHGRIGVEEIDRNLLPLLPGLYQLVGIIRRYRFDFDGQLVVDRMGLMKPAAARCDVNAGQIAHGARSNRRYWRGKIIHIAAVLQTFRQFDVAQFDGKAVCHATNVDRYRAIGQFDGNGRLTVLAAAKPDVTDRRHVWRLDHPAGDALR